MSEKNLENRFAQKVAAGLTAIIIGGIGLTGCDDAEECKKMNLQANGGSYIGATFNAEGDYKCPEGCTYDGETEDKYCCWCPD